MRALLMTTVLLLPALALAGGAMRDAKDALRSARDLSEDTDARCARPLQRKLDDLDDELRDVSRGDTSPRRALTLAREVRDWVDTECPGKLARSVGDELDTVVDALSDVRHAAADDRDDRRARPREDARPVVRRDCGTGEDPGCNLALAGHLPMDATAWSGFVASLKANNSDILKLDLVRQVMRDNYLTAKQLGPVLDCFLSELIRVDAARAAAPHVVDRAHALGHAAKFHSSIMASDYMKAMTP